MEGRNGHDWAGAVHRVVRALAGVVVAGIAGCAAVVAMATPAAADGAGGAVTDDSGIDYGALVGDGNGGQHHSGGSGGGSGPSCTYRLMGGPENFPVYDVDGNLIETTAGGAWYEKTCDGVFYGAVYLVGPPNAVDPAVVAAGVLKRMTIPLPQVAFSPTGDQIVNLPSWFWIPNWEQLNGTATVGGVSVRVTARPSSARWSFGDGTTSTCAPGIPWTPTADASRACTHTWARSSAAQGSESYRLSVTVNWSAAYTVTGGAGGGTLAPLSRTTTTPVRVAEVQAVNDRAGR